MLPLGGLPSGTNVLGLGKLWGDESKNELRGSHRSRKTFFNLSLKASKITNSRLEPFVQDQLKNRKEKINIVNMNKLSVYSNFRI